MCVLYVTTLGHAALHACASHVDQKTEPVDPFSLAFSAVRCMCIARRQLACLHVMAMVWQLEFVMGSLFPYIVGGGGGGGPHLDPMIGRWACRAELPCRGVSSSSMRMEQQRMHAQSEDGVGGSRERPRSSCMPAASAWHFPPGGAAHAWARARGTRSRPSRPRGKRMAPCRGLDTRPSRSRSGCCKRAANQPELDSRARRVQTETALDTSGSE